MSSGMKRTRAGLIMAIGLTGLMSVPGPAAAAAGTMVDVKKNIELTDNGQAATMTVIVKCPAGSSFSIDPVINQYESINRTYAFFDTPTGVSGTCTGKRERIKVTVTPTTEVRPDAELLGGYHATLYPTQAQSAQAFLVTTVSVAFTVDGSAQSYSSEAHVLK